MNTNLWANPQIANAYQTDPRLGYAQQLMQQGGSTSPVRSPLEGLVRALQGGLGGWQAGNVRKGYEKQDQEYTQGLAAALKDPDIIGAMSKSQSPYLQQMGLQAQVQRAMSPEKDPLMQVYDPATKTMVYRPQSQAMGQQAAAPEQPKAPTTRSVGDGRGGKIDQEYDPSVPGGWRTVGATPKDAPLPPEIVRTLNALGIDRNSELGKAAIAHALGTDSPTKTAGITTLYDPQTMQPKSFRDNDPAIDEMLKQGWTEKGPGSSGITITNPDGTTTQIGGTAKAPNATQSTAAGRGTLLATGMAAIKDVDMSQVSPEKMAAVGTGKAMLPNSAGGYLQAKALNAEEQKLLAGQGAITEAVTAAITGAAYAPAQLVNYQNIFVPVAGEDPAVTVGKLQRGAVFLKQLDEMAAGSRLPIDQLPPEMIRAAVDAATSGARAATPPAVDTSGLSKEERKKKWGVE